MHHHPPLGLNIVSISNRVFLKLAAVSVLAAVLLLGGLPGCKKVEEAAEKGAETKQKSSNTEATANLGAISDGAQLYFRDEHVASDGRSTFTRRFPSASPFVCTSGGEADQTVPPSATDWSVEPWKSLGFAMTRPHAFRYCYESSPDQQRFAAWAVSGEVAFCIKGENQSGKPVISSPRELGPDEECLY